ncbi:MAG: sulfurtransferase [Xanthomonadaceae bacterium]|jgi:thiosulfate/3-mercaptopyruvate sulfurtransferase|nr:sulfurtransferase [Xanthomonadaceae bacterium]
MSWTILVGAGTLATALNGGASLLCIVDARFSLGDPQAGLAGYRQSHLPGAVHADLDRDLSDRARTGHGRHPLPDMDRFMRHVGEWGIGPEHQVVVYDAGDGSMAAARFWWMLRLCGHRKVAVLDGGLSAWRAAGLPETDAAPRIRPLPAYPGHFDRSRVVTVDEVMARLSEPAGWLWDARAAERFRGEVEPIDLVAGHVPGAVNWPFARNMQDGVMTDGTALGHALRAQLQGLEPQRVVLMCGSGVSACHLLLAFEAAGLPGPRIYADSWSGWISDPARPVATGDD